MQNAPLNKRKADKKRKIIGHTWCWAHSVLEVISRNGKD